MVVPPLSSFHVLSSNIKFERIDFSGGDNNVSIYNISSGLANPVSILQPPVERHRRGGITSTAESNCLAFHSEVYNMIYVGSSRNIDICFRIIIYDYYL